MFSSFVSNLVLIIIPSLKAMKLLTSAGNINFDFRNRANSSELMKSICDHLRISNFTDLVFV